MPRILIIDDDPTIARLLYEHLSVQGYEVDLAGEGQEGLTNAIKTPPHLILLDVTLPDATGFQMCGWFRENPRTRNVPIILLTGTAKTPNQQALGKKMGASDYILKPFEIDDVIAKIKRVLEVHHRSQTRPASQIVQEEPPTASPIKIEQEEARPSQEATSSMAAQNLPVFNLTPILEPEPVPVPAPQARAAAPELSPSGVNTEALFQFVGELLNLANNLPTTKSASYVADQLVKSATSVGAKILNSESATSKADAMHALELAARDLQDASSWLLVIRKANLPKIPALHELEKKCQEFTATLLSLTSHPK